MSIEGLAEAAEFFYDACELYEDDDLDPDDHLAVIVRAFTSSHCDDFAAVVSAISNCEVMTFSWVVPGVGPGHHTLLMDGDANLFDVTGFVEIEDLRLRYGLQEAAPHKLEDAFGSTPLIEEGTEEWAYVIEAIMHLPHEPFVSMRAAALAHSP